MKDVEITIRGLEPTSNTVLCERLKVLSNAVTKGPEAVSREFTMRVPANKARDADLVLFEAAKRIERQEHEILRLRIWFSDNAGPLARHRIGGFGFIMGKDAEIKDTDLIFPVNEE